MGKWINLQKRNYLGIYYITISTYNITTLGKYVCDRTHSQAKCKNDK